MTYILDGGEKETRQRRWIQNSHDDVEEEKTKNLVRDDSDRSRSDLVADAMKHFMDIHWKHLKRGYKTSGNDMTHMSAAKFGLTGPLSLHYGVFMSTLRSQTSQEQRDWWLDAGYKLNFIGCYAQTELGWGSNVRALKTTATFVPGAGIDGDGEWEIHTPTLRSIKWWSTGLFSATHAALYAQLILNGESKGVHVFFVQLRGPDLTPLKGIEMGDIGRKIGDNDTPIGYLRLNKVRIPRRHLMEARAHVTRDGKYVVGPPRYSTPSKSTKKKKKKKDKNVSHYITMLKTRIGLTNTAGAALAKAATIAVRYSAVRHQGFKAISTSRRFDDPENSVLDYQNQLFRMLKWTASAYSMKFVARWLLSKRKKMERGGDVDQLPEVHACAAGLKALCCCDAADGIEDLRRACGGHGYLLSSGIAALEGDFKGPNTTAEGDFVVLALQTARFLIKSLKNQTHRRLVGTISILEPLRQDQKIMKPISPSNLEFLLCDTSKMSMKSTREYLANLFAYRSLIRCAAMMKIYNNHLNTCHQNNHPNPEGFARENSARAMQSAALAHVRYFIVSKFFEEVDAVSSHAEHLVLHKLSTFHALTDLLTQSWGGLLEQHEFEAFNNAASILMKSLRPECVALVDAFDFTDTILNSALGSSDGNVYEKLYETARVSAMNIDKTSGRRVEVPPCLRAVEKYLSKDFLMKGLRPSSSVHHPGSRL